MRFVCAADAAMDLSTFCEVPPPVVEEEDPPQPANPASKDRVSVRTSERTWFEQRERPRLMGTPKDGESVSYLT